MVFQNAVPDQQVEQLPGEGGHFPSSDGATTVQNLENMLMGHYFQTFVFFVGV